MAGGAVLVERGGVLVAGGLGPEGGHVVAEELLLAGRRLGAVEGSVRARGGGRRLGPLGAGGP